MDETEAFDLQGSFFYDTTNYGRYEAHLIAWRRCA